MAKHRSYSIEFERQVAQEYLGGETLHGLSRMGLCRMASTTAAGRCLSLTMTNHPFSVGVITTSRTRMAKAASISLLVLALKS
ncbi:MAG TPA: hypothetical protein VKB89_25740 [Xanthobacteraceae bacterium]|nr:hypothetical protein [Xanthobacteraceae bacterium]